MKNNIAKFMGLALAILVIPTVSFAASKPTVTLIGATRAISSGIMEVTTEFNSNGTSFYETSPYVYIEYTNEITKDKRDSNAYQEEEGRHNTTYTLYGLSSGTKYSYRAVMTYDGRTYRTESKTFTSTGNGPSVKSTSTSTNSNSNSNSGSNTTKTNTSNSASTNTTYTNNSTNTSSSGASILNVSNIGKSVKSSIYTAGSNHANGVAIGISDTQARVAYDDNLDFTVQLQNSRSTSLANSELVIELPEEYVFVSSSFDPDYDESTNTITFAIGRVTPGGTIKEVTFKARAIGDGNREVKTTATWYYEGGSISASDRDEYDGGSKSLLGASVFGAGFFPQTFGGWVLIILLITAIIIIARRYMAPKPKPVPQAQPVPAPAR